jgi:[acyl-carrier-protein] S-malonyltransferase
VTIACDNAPEQIVVAGSQESLGQFASLVREVGGRSITLDVTGAFHSSAMEQAVSLVRTALSQIDIRSPEIPVVSNVTARPYQTPDEIRRLLAIQVRASVRWRESLEWLWGQGVRTFEDFGPGRVVSGFVAETFGGLHRPETLAPSKPRTRAAVSAAAAFM